MQAKVDAKEDFMGRKREEQAKLREARAEEARIRDELARKRLDYKASSHSLSPCLRLVVHSISCCSMMSPSPFFLNSNEDAAKLNACWLHRLAEGRHVWCEVFCSESRVRESPSELRE